MISTLDIGQALGNNIIILIRYGHQRPDEGVPGVQEGNGELGGNDRSCQRDKHLGEDRKTVSAIQKGGFLQLLGQAFEKLAHQESAIGRKQPGDDQGG